MVRGPDSSAKSIFSMYKLSASGCLFTSTICPTLISNLEGTTSSATATSKNEIQIKFLDIFDMGF